MTGTEAAQIWDNMTGMQKLNVLISIGISHGDIKGETIEEQAETVSIHKFGDCMYNLQDKIINYLSKTKKG